MVNSELVSGYCERRYISDVETPRTMVKPQPKKSERLKAELTGAHRQLQGKNPEAGEQL